MTGGATLAASTQFVRRAKADTPPIKIGVLLPRSGFLALIGQQCQRGADIAVPILRERGYSLELMNADFESKPDVARSQAEKLIRDGAHVLVGAFESGATLAIAQVCVKKRHPVHRQYRRRPSDHRAGLQIHVPQFPHEHHDRHARIVAVQVVVRSDRNDPEDRGAHAHQRQLRRIHGQGHPRTASAPEPAPSPSSTRSPMTHKPRTFRSRSPRPRLQAPICTWSSPVSTMPSSWSARW